MIQHLQVRLTPEESHNEAFVARAVQQQAGVSASQITGYHIKKRSIDARGRKVMVQLAVGVYIDEPYQAPERTQLEYKDVRNAPPAIIVGLGPAGLFAALRLIELGIKPIILERGKDVRARRRDLAQITKQGEVNPESNYCFGEGGAGTYSDGKLYTRSTKRGNVQRILDIFIEFGADPNIGFEAHPHIGTNKLPQIITAMREQVEACGGEVHFNTKVVGLLHDKGAVTGVATTNGGTFKANSVILATGHSARDIFEMLHAMQLELEVKPFALGVRVEHPQELIDSIQYSCPTRGDFLPPASYSLVHQAMGRGVFSFCMCPGGIIAPAATNPNEVVVNGWSPSKRNNPYANSGMVVSVEGDDFKPYAKYGPLAAMHFQADIERIAFDIGGGQLVAPAQRMVDFTQRKVSTTLPGCSYIPGTHSADLWQVLPKTVSGRLAEALQAFGKKMRGYYTNEALLVGVESRTSTPVRIPRDEDTLQHPQLKGLYPCGEGAGYAGGIVSAAMDGERCAEMVKLLKG